MMQDVRPAPGTVFVMGDASYNFPPRVDARTHALTVDPAHALPLVVLSGDGDLRRDALGRHLRGDGDRFFYMAFPNADNHQLRLLMNDHSVVATKRYDRRGYAFDLYTFRFSTK